MPALGIAFYPRDGNDALMLLGPGEAVQLAALLKPHGNTAPPGELDDLFDAPVPAPTGNHDTLERTAGDERFVHGVDAGELFHRLSPARRRIQGCGRGRSSPAGRKTIPQLRRAKG